MKKKETRNRKAYDSMSQFCADTGWPKDKVRRAKAQGAPGFRGSRVYVGELEPWLRRNRKKLERADTGEALKVEKLREEIKWLRLQNERDEERLIHVDTVRETFRELCDESRKMLYRKLVHEWPKRIRGKSPEQVREISKAVNDEVCEEMRKLGEK